MKNTKELMMIMASILLVGALGRAEPRYSSMMRSTDGFASECSNYITDLENAERKAGTQSMNGGFDRATATLIAKLDEKAANLPSPGSDDVFPRTVEAIRNADVVANMVLSKLAEKVQSGKLPGSTANEAGYYMMIELYKVVKMAYYELDKSLFESRVSCIFKRHCDWQIPEEYIEGLNKLAQGFIDVQKTVEGRSADMTVELTGAEGNVTAAANILSTSIAATEFPCTIEKLNNLASWIQDVINGNAGITVSMAKKMVRDEIATVDLIKVCGNHSHKHRDDDFGSSEDND